uniref:Alpha/beta-hydrolase n=1 Tax=Bionectria ochroleuca TaxID=29856 RepID=A0A8H7THZ5_BIOOC
MRPGKLRGHRIPQVRQDPQREAQRLLGPRHVRRRQRPPPPRLRRQQQDAPLPRHLLAGPLARRPRRLPLSHRRLLPGVGERRHPGDNQTTSAREAPRMILVTVRHEAPYYDDSYAVNTANLGPYGDAINDELIPHIDTVFNTIAEPYARVQEGGSTGGWISIASVIFRPDLFGACFSSYPDSLDFHKHQDIPLYTSKNAYRNEDGSEIGSIREFVDKKEHVLATVRQENHWELVFGTSSRSANQWDVWNAVFGVQGLNGYPLEPWDKITGEIYPEAVEYWKEMDLANYILENWDTERNLGEALRERLFVWVGEWDNYYLNEGVKQFQDRIEAKGGVGWANVTILPEKTHGGNYQAREIWNYLELVYGWIQDHAPDGKTPLSSEVTAPSGRGNIFSDVISVGGREAALARQAPPSIEVEGSIIKGTVGRWDPGVVLEAQWVVDGKPKCGRFKVTPGSELKHKTKAGKSRKVELWVTGSKRGYETETRRSNSVTLE